VRPFLFLVLFVLLSAAPHAQETETTPTFDDFLAGLRAEALQRGISAATVEKALSDVHPLPVVLERDRGQAEHVFTPDQYIKRRLTPAVIRTARRLATTHKSLLQRVAVRYKVPRGIVLAIWGLESNFGRFSGVRPTIQALATLAFDNRRAALFRSELFYALQILDRGDIELERLKGSWAGAMGQPQFLPSSYLQHAVDFDEDGRADIWRSQADVFASIANYVKARGWAGDERWGREVKVSKSVQRRVENEVPMRKEGCRAVREMTEPLPLARWRALGVAQVNGKPLPKADLNASLVGAGRRTFLVYRNYHALLEYNCAHAYALSVALLADRIGS
jgi:membrane-bound lytic murein transglycosylase B